MNDAEEAQANARLVMDLLTALKEIQRVLNGVSGKTTAERSAWRIASTAIERVEERGS